MMRDIGYCATPPHRTALPGNRMRFWRGRPASYDIADIRKDLLDASYAILNTAVVSGRAVLLPEQALADIPAADGAYDCILSFTASSISTPCLSTWRNTATFCGPAVCWRSLTGRGELGVGPAC